MELPQSLVALISSHSNSGGPRRDQTFLAAVNHIFCQKEVCIIETGTMRNADPLWPDGGSTIIFGTVAKDLGAEFYSVDNKQEHIKVARSLVGDLPVEFIESDSVVFLSNFNRPISMLYLDSRDYVPGDELMSQLHHVAEFGAACGKLTEDAVVLVDDCGLDNGGKGGLLTPYLLSNGWRLAVRGYQSLFIRV